MKKQAFIIFALLTAVFVNAQDTLYYGNPYYMFNPGYPNNYSIHYYQPLGLSEAVYGNVAMQPYVAPSSTGPVEEDLVVYGVAMTLATEMHIDTPWYTVGVYNRTNHYRADFAEWIHYGDFQERASVWKDGTIRRCSFGYILDSNGAMSNSYEYYFNEPVRVRDTFYVGFVLHGEYASHPKYSPPCCGMDVAEHGQTWWIGGLTSLNTLTGLVYDDSSSTYSTRWWGALFPIIGLRCTAPREGEVIQAEGDSVVIQFVDDGEEHQYEVVYARDGFGVDTTAGERTAAPDSLFTFRGLEAGMRYWYRVRRSCTIGNMTVWSPWSQGYRLPATVGIRPDMEPVALEVKPNPANEYVEVTAEVPEGSLELRDAQGRLHLSQRLEGGHARIELQGVPAGVYTLQLRSAEGNATRRLIVK